MLEDKFAKGVSTKKSDELLNQLKEASRQICDDEVERACKDAKVPKELQDMQKSPRQTSPSS